ncbi:C-factor [subsurface metagenome]
MFVTQALLPNLLKAENAKIAIVTSRVGSIGDNSSGGMYAYRSSKAAANSIGKTMAMDLQKQNIPVLLLHPGFVRSGLLPGNDGDQFVDPPEAATKLWNNVVKPRGMESTGKFYHREGYELPW